MFFYVNLYDNNKADIFYVTFFIDIYILLCDIISLILFIDIDILLFDMFFLVDILY